MSPEGFNIRRLHPSLMKDECYESATGVALVRVKAPETPEEKARWKEMGQRMKLAIDKCNLECKLQEMEKDLPSLSSLFFGANLYKVSKSGVDYMTNQPKYKVYKIGSYDPF